jgi:hypothetical protein
MEQNTSSEAIIKKDSSEGMRHETSHAALL